MGCQCAKCPSAPVCPINTVRRWLRQGTVEPVYPARKRPCIIDAYRDQLEVWLRTDRHRPKRD